MTKGLWSGAAAVAVVMSAAAGAAPAGAVGTIITDRPAVVSTAASVPGTASNVTLVGHLAPGINVGDTTPAGQYGALSIAGNCAYIGRRSFNSSDNADNGLGVQIVDISNPAAPVYKGTIPGTALVDSTARELRAVDQYKLLIVMHYSRFTGGGVHPGPYPLPAPVGTTGVDSGGRNQMQAFHINADCSATMLGYYDLNPIKPHEFYTWLDPKRPGGVITYVSTPFGPPDMAVLDWTSCSTVNGVLPTACAPSLVTLWSGGFVQPNPAAINNSGLGNYLHSLSVTPDGRTGLMAYWNGGFFTVDTSQIADHRSNPVIVGEASTSLRDDWSHHLGPLGQGGDAHSAAWVPADANRYRVQPYAVLTDEDYLGVGDCPFGWVHLDRLDSLPGGQIKPTPVSSFGVPENLLTQEAAAITFQSRVNGKLAGADTCAGYNRDHPGFIGASSAWPGGQIPANIYSSHNPTVLPDLVLLTYYGGGFRVIDIHDVTHSAYGLPKDAGVFVPTPEPVVNEEFDDPTGQLAGCYYPITPTATNPANCTVRDGNLNSVNYVVHPQVEAWSYPIVKNGLIYFVDNRNGLYVVQYTGSRHHEVDVTAFAEGNSNNGTVNPPWTRPAPLLPLPSLPPVPAAGHPAGAPAATAPIASVASRAVSGLALAGATVTAPALGLPLAFLALALAGLLGLRLKRR